jgi:hypothetical protein
MSLLLISQEVPELSASLACTADRMPAIGEALVRRASVCETASRVAFLTAHRLAKTEEILPVLGHTFHRANFAIA